jgi:hypothetical protein
MLIAPTGFYRAVALFGALGLGACAGAPPAATSVDEPEAIQSTPAPAPGPVAALVAPTAPRAPPRRATLLDLVGLTAADAARLFGRPALVRREAPAEVRQYVGGRCVLLLFLYPDGDSLKVRHAEITSRSKSDKVGDSECLDELRRPGAPLPPPSS